ncbi:MAG: DedA family protein [Betaproteobacteria bacterium]|nr:DedA family protein [Betaproteobacteria bacterium]
MLNFSPETGLSGLAASAFLSATLLPGNSEAVLLAVLSQHLSLFWPAVAVATAANTAGGMTSYALGRLVPKRVEHRALAWLSHRGAAMLVFAWVPVIGDALCVAAGWLRLSPWVATFYMALGKGMRYLAVAMLWERVTTL